MEKSPSLCWTAQLHHLNCIVNFFSCRWVSGKYQQVRENDSKILQNWPGLRACCNWCCWGLPLKTMFDQVRAHATFFLSVLPSSGISPCGWTNWAVMPSELGAALLCSSRAGSDMWLLSRNSIVHRDWGRTIGVCVAS